MEIMRNQAKLEARFAVIDRNKRDWLKPERF